MSTRQTWITSGDRSHPNLIALDDLNPSYPGHVEDVVRAEEAHTNLPIEFKHRLFEISEKQRIFLGNRSHPRLLSLDSLELDYPDWHMDFDKAQEYHVCFPDLFEGKICGMLEKQKMHHGDRSHRNLVALDKLTLKLKYPEYLEDVADAEDIHTSKPFMFQERLFEIQEKQKIFEGDRSHARLQALDSCDFTYPQWKRDFEKAQQYHMRFPELFHGKLKGMIEKQNIHNGDRTHPNLRLLDDIKRTTCYPNHKDDLLKAEHAHTNIPQEFAARVFEIQEKQKMFEGDRSHPRLRELDDLVLNYPEWRKDFKKAEHYHLKYSDLFNAKLMGMREKQRIYRGDLLRRQQQEAVLHNSNNHMDTGVNVPQSPFSSNTTLSAEQQQRQKNTDHCVICWQFERTHAFVPCGHLCICANCVEATMDNGRQICPICRQKTTQAIKVYFS